MVTREMCLKFLVKNPIIREQIKILGGYVKTDCRKVVPKDVN
jgi:hypothetical protein